MILARTQLKALAVKCAQVHNAVLLHRQSHPQDSNYSHIGMPVG